MTGPAHNQRAHALLGASKASQWLNCPPSAVLQESVPDSESEYAKEGTVAHELAEVKLQQLLGLNNAKARKALDKALIKIKESPFYGPEMESAITDYAEIVAERYMEAKARSTDAVIMFEDRLDFSEWVPDGFGTGDVLIISDDIMDVIDLKYGKGVPVYAVGNSQMRLYALGAWQEYNFLYGIRDIRMTIIQPRLDSVSEDSISVEDLLDWAENIVRPAAALAAAGEGEFLPGDHCRWCKVKATCRARADANMMAIQYEFKDPALLTIEEVGSILFVAEELQKWAKDVGDYAYEQATKHGVKVPSWKLVEGRSNRALSDKEAAKAALEAAGYEQDKYLKPQELLGIGELEKRLGKKDFVTVLADLVIKPPGKPALVAESDARPELNSIDKDFANEEF